MYLFVHVPKCGGTSVLHWMNRRVLHGKVQYGYHDTDVHAVPEETRIITVIREPGERFASAVRYLFSFAHLGNDLREIGCTSPNQWAEALADPSHPHHKLVLPYVENNKHRIGKRVLDWEWTYSPQSLWIREGKNDVIWTIDELQERFSKLMEDECGIGRDQSQLGSHNVTVKKGENASTCKTDDEYSDAALAFLRKTYAEDYALWEKYGTPSQTTSECDTVGPADSH